MKAMKFGYFADEPTGIRWVFAQVGNAGILVPADRSGPCPELYTVVNGQVLGSDPDAWLKVRGIEADEFLAKVLERLEETDEHGFTEALTAKDPAAGSVSGWKWGMPEDGDWRNQAADVAAACKLPAWIPPLIQGDFGVDGGPLAAWVPRIRWVEVAEHLLTGEGRPSLAYILTDDGWDAESATDATVHGVPRGARIAMVEAGLRLRVVPKIALEEAQAPAAAPAVVADPERKPAPKPEVKEERPAKTPEPRRQGKERSAPPSAPVAKKEVPAPTSAAKAEESSPPLDMEALAEGLEPQLRSLFYAEAAREEEKCGGDKATAGARRRAVMTAWNNVRQGRVRPPNQGLTRAERKAEKRAHLAVVPPAEPAAATPTEAPPALAEVSTPAVPVAEEIPPAPEAAPAAEEPTPPPVEEQVAAEVAKADAFVEVPEGLRLTAAARVAAGEDRETVILDLLTTPPATASVAEAKPKKAKAAKPKAEGTTEAPAEAVKPKKGKAVKAA